MTHGGPVVSIAVRATMADEEAVASTSGLGFHLAESSALLGEGSRMHLVHEGRYLTLLRIKGAVACMDSVCYHAGGPLGLGDIEDLGDKTVILCPWHRYKVDVWTGDKYYQGVKMVGGKMQPGEWQSNGVKQRCHPVTEQAGHIYVQLMAAGGDVVASDEYACNAPCGERVLHGVLRHPGAHTAGADGVLRKPSGHVLQAAREQRAASNLSALPGPLAQL